MKHPLSPPLTHSLFLSLSPHFTCADAAVGVVAECVDVEAVAAGLKAADVTLHQHPLALGRLRELDGTLHVEAQKDAHCLCCCHTEEEEEGNTNTHTQTEEKNRKRRRRKRCEVVPGY
jgi:hypothetical protein